MKIKNVSKLIAAGMLLVVPLCLTGCKDDSGTIVETKANYNVSVPRKDKDKSMKFSVNIPFYRITKNNPGLDKIDDNQVISGKDLEIKGTNVEDLKGVYLRLNQSKLSDLIKEDKDYYKMIIKADSYNNRKQFTEKDIEKMSQEEIEKTIKENAKQMSLDEAKKKVEPYLDSYVVSGMISYSGTISDDVIIKSVSVPKYKFKYTFDNCRIEIAKHDIDKIAEDDGKQIDDANMFINFVGPIASNVTTTPLQGKALTKIDDISMITMNDDIKVINANNKKHSFDKGKNINLLFDYELNNGGEKKELPVGTMASFVYQIKSGNKTYWIPMCQASCVDGKYLVLDCFKK